ncbi:E3 SUMO-protein ligase KIAA1586-like [Metopolophium dirhodum]|uniref:E3 SUMO-protein ligase KIAA1586-like n=1 Tax=Metopolophium dirhodum TaxID=44670 RepID=UPI00298FCD5E|nr:E3 SUMO-protein ligase KIAA1586-like [Metopolophium dirhodum]
MTKNQVSHVHVSSNWIQYDIVPTGNSISKQQASLRKKISKHKCSQSHISAENIINRNMPKLIDLQALNGVNMGRVLQTNKSCANIVDHISNEMRLKICNDIIENNRKLCIVVDESTTLSKKTMLVICLRCANDFLKQNLVGFVSDGASNMLGRKAGVGVLLQNIFPDLIIWHCCNHRLELAVSDTIKAVQGLNHLKCFFEKLYSLYHQSPKNMTELNACAASLESSILNIGKIFTIRWVASSIRTVRAVWNNYVALHKYFQESSIDNKRDGKERSKYLGINNMLTSKDFVFNLGMLYDVLNELSDLSLQLQKRDLGLAKAHNMID